jgi:hypothetical protein
VLASKRRLRLARACLLSGALVAGALAASAGAEVRTVVPYSDGGYSYKQVATGAEPGFEQPTFVPTGFLGGGLAPFGSNTGLCPAYSTFRTAWAQNTDMLLRRTIQLPPGTTGVTVGVAIDNGVQVFMNGTDVSGGIQQPGGCTFQDHATYAVPDGLLLPGPNLLAVRGQGAGDPNFLDVRVSADIETVAPETTIHSGPAGITTDSTPTFGFSSNEAGSSFACRVSGGPFAPCASPFTLPSLSGGSYTFDVRATDPAGNVDPTPARRTFSIAPIVPSAASILPPPKIGKLVNAEPLTGAVFVSVPATGARASAAVPGLKGRIFIPLSQARQVPVGSLFDTRKGSVRLTSARNAAGSTQSGEFRGGVFQTLQSGKRAAKGLTELRLKGASFASCALARRGKRASASARRKVRRLRGNARGRFRTRGRYSSATVRGTIWTVTDRCDGTLTEVARGRVAVRDLRRKKTVVLKAGKRYLARAPR